jgi:hypothetical protein
MSCPHSSIGTADRCSQCLRAPVHLSLDWALLGVLWNVEPALGLVVRLGAADEDSIL